MKNRKYISLFIVLVLTVALTASAVAATPETVYNNGFSTSSTCAWSKSSGYEDESYFNDEGYCGAAMFDEYASISKDVTDWDQSTSVGDGVCFEVTRGTPDAGDYALYIACNTPTATWYGPCWVNGDGSNDECFMDMPRGVGNPIECTHIAIHADPDSNKDGILSNVEVTGNAFWSNCD